MKTNRMERVKVAIVTGNDYDEVSKKIQADGYKVGAIVEKPFNETSLRNAVDKLL